MADLLPACRLSIYFGHADTHRHKALSGEILNRAHHAGLAGLTTLQGITGFGHTGTMHSTPRWAITDRSPITVHIIDAPEKIRAFLLLLDDLADQCLIVCDRVDVLSPAGRRDGRVMTAPTGSQLICDTRQAGQAAGSLDGVPEQCLIPGL